MSMITFKAEEDDNEIRVVIGFDFSNGPPLKPIVLQFGPDEDDPYTVASYSDETVWFHEPPDDEPDPNQTTLPLEESRPSQA